MNKKTFQTAALFLTALIVASFFLPWLNVESAAVGAFSKVLTGETQKTIDSISAFRVPIMANSDESRLMISIIKLFNPNITNADKKSYLIWVFPILAVVILILLKTLEKNPLVNLAIAIVGILIFLIATIKIFTTDMNKVVLQVSIGYGLWLTLIGFLGLGILGLVKFTQLQATKK